MQSIGFRSVCCLSDNDDDSLVVCEQNRCQLLLFTPQLMFYSTCDGMKDGDPYEFDSPWNVTAFLD